MSTTDTAFAPAEAPEAEDHAALDEDYVLTPQFVEKVVDAADDGDGMRLRSLLMLRCRRSSPARIVRRARPRRMRRRASGVRSCSALRFGTSVPRSDRVARWFR